MEAQFVVVYVTAPDSDRAKKLAGLLLDRRLAACVNVVPGVVSHYVWQGERAHDPELLLVIKTKLSHLEAIEAAAKEATGYDTPEVIALPVAGGSSSYLAWLDESC